MFTLFVGFCIAWAIVKILDSVFPSPAHIKYLPERKEKPMTLEEDAAFKRWLGGRIVAAERRKRDRERMMQGLDPVVPVDEWE